jgi:hypothetical protein
MFDPKVVLLQNLKKISVNECLILDVGLSVDSILLETKSGMPSGMAASLCAG